MKKVYLVMNLTDSGLPFVEMYQIFSDRQKAIDHAISLGFSSMFGFTDTVGVKSVYYADVKVEFIPLIVE